MQTKPKGQPLLVTATGTVTPRSTGGVNAIALKNSSNAPIEIHRIAFTISATSDAASQFNPQNLGVKLDLGSIALTNGFVPAANFGPRQIVEASGATDTGIYTSQVIWKLGRPLFIPPGGALVPTFEHRARGIISMDVRADYSGQKMPVGYKPKKVFLPYVSSYVSSVFDASESGSDMSSETDILNPFNEPIFIERFVGRVSVFTNESQVDLDNLVLPIGSYTIRMVDSRGHRIVRDPAVFGQVFWNPLRTWELGGKVQLDSGAHVIVELFKTSLGLTENTVFTQAAVSLVGWREIGGVA